MTLLQVDGPQLGGVSEDVRPSLRWFQSLLTLPKSQMLVEVEDFILDPALRVYGTADKPRWSLWHDLVDATCQLIQEISSTPLQHEGHPLLRSWGKLLHLVEQLETRYQMAFARAVRSALVRCEMVIEDRGLVNFVLHSAAWFDCLGRSESRTKRAASLTAAALRARLVPIAA